MSIYKESGISPLWSDWEKRTNLDRFKIGLIMTGGTIVSVPNEHGALEPAKDPEELLQFVPHLYDHGDIEIIPLMNKDSSNMVSADWTKIALEISRRSLDYDAFLVTHGTDTMSYSATAVRFALGPELFFPVVFTGSQLPINVSRTDAITNIEDALAALNKARKERVNEVMIVADRQVFRGVRSVKSSDSKFDFISSPGFGPLGESTVSGIQFTHPDTRRVKVGMPDEELPGFGLGNKVFNDSIISLRIQPNTSEKALRSMLLAKDAEYSAIILTSLGAGNTPERLLDLIKEVTKRNIPVLIAPPETGMDTAVTYEVARLAAEAGAIQTRDMTGVAASVKASWLLGNTYYQRQLKRFTDAFLKDSFGEVSTRRLTH